MPYYYKDADEALKKAVWEKGKKTQTHEASVHRKDICGNWMQYDQHGKEGDYGWEIDHIKPVAKGGGDELSNLQPLWWKNNRRKSDTYPWSC